MKSNNEHLTLENEELLQQKFQLQDQVIQGALVRKVSDVNPYGDSTKSRFWKFSDINSPMVVLAPRGAKTTIGELISENFHT